MNASTIKRSIAENVAATESYLKALFSETLTGNNRLTDAMQYALLGGGKRLRAFLVNETGRAFGASFDKTVPFAAAIEMIHAYSLIHDDLPCMDNDDMRRGKPSCHIAFGEANALLAGDTLLTYAFEVAASNGACSDKSVRLAVTELARCAGALGMCGGQFLDLRETVSSVEEIYQTERWKTGALLSASCLLGYYAATDEPDEASVRALRQYAENIGIAFQIMDDILDVTATAEELGKPIGSDAKNGKKTVLSFLTMEKAVDAARRYTEDGIAAVRDLPAGGMLSSLAVYLLDRRS